MTLPERLRTLAFLQTSEETTRLLWQAADLVDDLIDHNIILREQVTDLIAIGEVAVTIATLRL